MKIKILVTGGTIDDIDYVRQEDSPKDHTTYIPSLLRQSKVTFPYEIEELMSKDSRFVSDGDRQTILEKCRDCKEQHILVTHGSISMPITAKFLGKENLPKTIVLLGSIIPANKKDSDALFNLGAAFAGVQLLKPGVYVVMNGIIFTWDNVRKNTDTGFFENER